MAPSGGTPPLTPGYNAGNRTFRLQTPGSAGSGTGRLSPSLSGKSSREEKIKVTVRVRPLSAREEAGRETCCWKFPNTQTLQYTEPVPDRSPYPSTYCFDRVFDPACASPVVYMEGARDVVMSSLGGMNATIFAYGQTSSGKTYTMKAVMECAVVDIFEHIQRTPNREYLIKVSAIEIYNEVVKDLLSPDKNAETAKAGLRLLDDPDRGTVVEKLSEVVVRSSAHLMRILEECEEQRSVGETMLNEASSRSHQIVRLMIESSPRGPAFGSNDGDQVYLSSLNFVDLAGSERASQTLAEGTRLKEGGHINRSLLTLGTVIRKLSSSGSSKNKVGHIPYRDSKLTRILQLSLGGNARTAIICTISPAMHHVDYTRNTLAFATRAKEVTNQAHVNVAVSDKMKLAQLERQVARLETELSGAGSGNELQVKESRISELEEQLNLVKRERDNAQARVHELSQRLNGAEEVKVGQKLASWRMLRMRRKSGFSRSASVQLDDDTQPSPSHRDSEVSSTEAAPRSHLVGPGHRGRRKSRKSLSQTSLALISEIRNLEHMQDELGEDANKAMEALLKEIECMRVAQAGMNHHAADTIQKLQHEIRNIQELQGRTQQGGSSDTSTPVTVESLQEELLRLQSSEQSAGNLEAQLESVQQSLDQMCEESESRGSLKEDSWPSARHARKSSLGGEEKLSSEPFAGSGRETPSGEAIDGASNGTKLMASQHRRSSSLDLRKMQTLFKTAAEDNIRSIRNYVTELKERVAKLHFQKQLLVCQVLELEASQKQRDSVEESESIGTGDQSQGKLAEIYELWDACQVSLVHRTQFHLLITGEPGDSIYTEVEHRRLVWLRDRCQDASNHKEQAAMANRAKQVQRERVLLARRMKKRLSEEERNQLFENWGVPADAKKRKLQLAHKLWEDPKDMDSNAASAELVAHIMGFQTDTASCAKEMFQLSLGSPKLEKPFLIRLFSIKS